MLVSYFSPLAPAVVLLLSAFILSIIPGLPAHWRTHRLIRYFSAPGLVGLAMLVLLGIRLTVGQDASGEGLELLSGWNFSTAASAAALTVRADELSLPFLILILLVLLVVTLAGAPLTVTINGGRRGGWLALGAVACILFVSANGLTLSYAILAFDALTAFYWLKRGHSSLSVARLFLGVVTANALVLTSLAPAAGIMSGMFLLGLVLWLRLGLYPFVEANALVSPVVGPGSPQMRDAVDERGSEPSGQHNEYAHLTYLTLSLAVGIYLVIRVSGGPFAQVLRWLTAITMLLNGSLTWLAETPAGAITEQRAPLLIRLVLTEVLLILLVPLPKTVVVAYGLGLILSLAGLWVTPRLGQPRLTERAWAWPYLPALAATLTLIGLPFSLGWPARTGVYQTLLLSDNLAVLVVVILAEILALSGLARYWTILWQGNEGGNERRLLKGVSSAAGIVALVPFLIPGLAPLMLSTITMAESSPLDFGQPTSVFIALAVTIIGAAGLGYFGQQMIDRLKIPPEALTEFVGLRWLLPWPEEALSWAGKLILRASVILEGQNYMGWALFAALVGALVILFRT